MRKLKTLRIKNQDVPVFQITPQEFGGMYDALSRFLVLPDGRILIWREEFVTHDQAAHAMYPKVFKDRYDAYKNLPTKGYMRGVIGMEKSGEKILFFDLACKEKGLDIILRATAYLPGNIKTIVTEYDCDGKIMHTGGFEGRLSDLRSTTKTTRDLLGRGGPGDVYDGFSVYRNPPTSSAFKKWFGDSKVVDEQGEPLVCYHGTRDKKFTAFEKRKGTVATFISVEEVDRTGFFFTPVREFAEEFAGKDGRLIPVYLSIKNPADMRYDAEIEDKVEKFGINRRWLLTGELWEKFDGEDGEMYVNALKKAGYDGAIITELDGEGISQIVYVAFYPTQVKLAEGNDGTFDADDPNIASNPVKIHPESAYDPAELAMGIEVEAEHTSSPTVASRIARQHLEETPDYYSRLADAGLADNPPSWEEGKAKSLAKKFGAKIENHSSKREWNYAAVLPAGKLWSANGLHIIHVGSYKGRPQEREEMFKDLVGRMEYGTDQCDGVDCEHCHPVSDNPEYSGMHEAPTKGDGSAPLNDVTGIYPSDIYSYDAKRLYGDHSEDYDDGESIRIIQAYRHHPNKIITVYRAAPKDVPAKINRGDWVTINRSYAKAHGESNLKDYKIISKSVHARDLFTDGNSIHEWGYDPQDFIGVREEIAMYLQGREKALAAKDDEAVRAFTRALDILRKKYPRAFEER